MSADIGTNPTFPLKVAAIDVGSNGIRFIAAEFTSLQKFQIIQTLRIPVRLGHGVFLNGRIDATAIRESVEGLKSFGEEIRRLGIEHYRAVATSAVRESGNAETFIEQIRRETNLDLEIITGSEEIRLVHAAVRHMVPMGNDNWIMADLGGGSVEVALVNDRGILWSESHTMGAVRLLEELAGGSDEPGRFRRILEEYASTLRIHHIAQNHRPRGFIATGGNIETLCKLALGETQADHYSTLSVRGLRGLVEKLSMLSYRQRVEQLGLREDRADVILPAALVYERLAVLADVQEIIVPHKGLKEGLLLDITDSLINRRAWTDRRLRDLMEGALALGRRYLFDEMHATHVSHLAMSLFDQLTLLHGLSENDRRLLLVAAILHDIGQFISYQRHHKHSLYLISQSELPGFSPRETLLIANIARYHRKNPPNSQHENLSALNAEERVKVSKLASILRLADALDREHYKKVSDVRLTIKDRRCQIRLFGHGDLLLEKLALQKKSQMFCDLFDMKLQIVEEKDGR